jgi:glycosyltransferase involved in cell wall biosynthesis
MRSIIDRGRQVGTRALIREAVQRLRRISHRRARSDAIAAERRPSPGSAFDVIYAIGYWAGEPKRYRVFNVVEELRLRGYAVHVIPFDRIDDIPYYRWTTTALILFRAEDNRLSDIPKLLSYARSRRMRVIYDIDDLVFDEAIAGCIDGLRLMGTHERRAYIRALGRRRRVLTACNLVTVSSAPLARAVTALGRPAAIVPNSLNREQLRVAEEIGSSPPRNDGIIRIGYFGGSRTHQRDFACCEAALLEAMARHPQVRFLLVGYLDLGTEWDRFTQRIERLGLLNPTELLRCLARTDINLAPLEIGNPFCESKSELKFFEAGLVGVPTVASATETFSAAIEDGVSGLTVRDPAQWLRALELLIGSASIRREMGQAARRRALARYGPDVMVQRAIAALGLGTPSIDMVTKPRLAVTPTSAAVIPTTPTAARNPPLMPMLLR